MRADPKTINLMMQGLSKAELRSGKTGQRLLDDAENNVGNATTLNPQVLPGTPWNYTTIKQATPPRVLNLTAASHNGQSMTVVMTAARSNQNAGVAGPITGILEFGNGTQNTRIEFDIPFGPFVAQSLYGVLPGTQPEDGGAAIQIPTGIIRAYARYDNVYITPNILNVAFGSPGSPFALPPGPPGFPPPSGPFPPNYVSTSQLAGSPQPGSTPAQIKAFGAYYGRVHSKLYRTLYLYNGDTTAPVTFGNPVQSINLDMIYSIPPFAKSVQVIRTPFNASMIALLTDLTAISGSGLGGYIPIPGGQSPIIPIVGNQTAIGITSAGAGDRVSAVSLVFEIGF